MKTRSRTVAEAEDQAHEPPRIHDSFATFASVREKCVESLFAKAAEHLEVCFMTDSAGRQG